MSRGCPRGCILQFVEWGIDGLEVYHVKGGDYVERLRSIAGELYAKLVKRCKARSGRGPR